MTTESDKGNSAKSLVEALESILEKAKEHPCYMHHSFETRDYDAICDEGGDCCDWTLVAIYADDALKEFNARDHQPEVRGAVNPLVEEDA